MVTHTQRGLSDKRPHFRRRQWGRQPAQGSSCPPPPSHSHLSHFSHSPLADGDAAAGSRSVPAATGRPPRLTLAAGANNESGFHGRTPSTAADRGLLVQYHRCFFKPENRNAEVIRKHCPTLFWAFTGLCVMALISWTWATHCITLLPPRITLLRKLKLPSGDVRPAAT